MHYLIQENLFKERNCELILLQFNKMDVTYDIVSILPFTEDICTRYYDKEKDENIYTPFITQHKNVFCFGSVKFAHIAPKYGWYPGSMYNINHDYEVYKEHYKNHLLNYDCIIQSIFEPISNVAIDLFFARPCKDTKLFNGGVFMHDSWCEMIEHIKCTVNHKDVSNDMVMFSTLKDIAYEARCWIVDGKVITMSEYKRGRYVIYKNIDDNLFLKAQVQQLVDIYQPADAFVMDICELIDNPGGLKIVEINCINCAGFYEGDMQRVIYALDEKFNTNEE